MYFAYTLLSLLFFVAAAPWFAWQAFRHRKYVGSLGQRLGRLPIAVNMDGESSLWIHAVSVGEVLTARALLPALRERYPHLRTFLSTTTMTGQQVARGLTQHLDGVFFFPLDLPWVVERTLERVRPQAFLMIETEIWPHLLRACRRRGIRTVLVNGRLSERSFRRYRLVRPLFRRVLGDLDLLCMQSEASANRIVELGADRARVVVTGSLKFDSVEPPAGAAALGRDRVLRFFRMREGRPVIVAASTLRGEEAMVFDAFREVRGRWSETLLVVAPRHPERFDEVETLARQDGFRVERRSALPIDAEPRADVVVLDTIGELARLFEIATVVFVGGSLVDAGGHNILEPAVFGKPVIIGPYMRNFAEIAAVFLVNGAAVEVGSARALADCFTSLIGDPVRRASLGAAARALVEANRGAVDRTLRAVGDVVPPASPHGGVVRSFRRVQ